MKLLGKGTVLLPAVAVAFLLSCSPTGSVQTMPQSWFRSKMNLTKTKLSSKFKSSQPQQLTPLEGIANKSSLEQLAARLNLAGLGGHQTMEGLLSIFEGLKSCFRNFAPPPGLALDFRPETSMTPDAKIGHLFIFLPPTGLLLNPTQQLSSRISATEEPLAGISESPVPVDDAKQTPLKPVKFPSDPKHILAGIIFAVFTHFRGPTCQQIAKRLDSVIRRVFIRKNTKAATMETLLVHSLVQGNIASANLFPTSGPLPTPGENAGELAQNENFLSPSNASSSPGVYDPDLIVTFYDLVKASATGPMRKLEKSLQKPVNEILVATKLFGNSLANPFVHKQITSFAAAVGTSEDALQKVVERLGFMSLESSEAVSILMPTLPKVASFVRGVGFFVFEGVFKQHGPYVMPGLPCGGNLTGHMLETFSGKKLTKGYYVYKYTQPIRASALPDTVWAVSSETQLAQHLLQQQPEGMGQYLVEHLPRVCVRSSLFDKCSKTPTVRGTEAENQLCDFVHKHHSFFFKVEGSGVFNQRKSMQPVATGVFARVRRALGRSASSVRRFFFSKTFAALVLGAGVGGLCIAAGLAGLLGGSMCAVAAFGATGLSHTLFTVAPFGVKPPIPLSLGAFLAFDFERNLRIAAKNFGGLLLPEPEEPKV